MNSSPGEYFVTICTFNKECLFGEIFDEKMVLNELGLIVQEEWVRTSAMRRNIEIDTFIVMPNHLHGIINIHETKDPSFGKDIVHHNIIVGANCDSLQNCHSSEVKPHNNPFNNGAYIDTPLQKTKLYSPSKTIGAIIRGFKSSVTKCINELHSTPGHPIWQRGYYEHIIRDDKDLDNVRDYIVNNPMKWLLKKQNPENIQLQ